MSGEDGGVASSERQSWMVEQIGVRPEDRVLELGHGHGVAASVICAVLAGGSGRYVGIDRSATMTVAAGRRLADHVDAGRIELLTSLVLDATLSGAFDLVVAIHFPPIDRGNPAVELAALAPHVRAGTRLGVGFQPLDAEGVDAVSFGSVVCSRRAGSRWSTSDGPRPMAGPPPWSSPPAADPSRSAVDAATSVLAA